MAIKREEILRRLRKNIEAGIPIIGTGAGTGISAKCEEMGGTDLIIVYNSGKFRMSGIGSTAGCLPIGKQIHFMGDPYHFHFIIKFETCLLKLSSHISIVIGNGRIILDSGKDDKSRGRYYCSPLWMHNRWNHWYGMGAISG